MELIWNILAFSSLSLKKPDRLLCEAGLLPEPGRGPVFFAIGVAAPEGTKAGVAVRDSWQQAAAKRQAVGWKGQYQCHGVRLRCETSPWARIGGPLPDSPSGRDSVQGVGSHGSWCACRRYADLLPWPCSGTRKASSGCG